MCRCSIDTSRVRCWKTLHHHCRNRLRCFSALRYLASPRKLNYLPIFAIGVKVDGLSCIWTHRMKIDVERFNHSYMLGRENAVALHEFRESEKLVRYFYGNDAHDVRMIWSTQIFVVESDFQSIITISDIIFWTTHNRYACRPLP